MVLVLRELDALVRAEAADVALVEILNRSRRRPSYPRRSRIGVFSKRIPALKYSL